MALITTYSSSFDDNKDDVGTSGLRIIKKRGLN